MLRIKVTLAALIVAVVGLCTASASDFSISGRPRWLKVKSEQEPVVVRDLGTHRELGQLAKGDLILAFGSTEKWVTFSYRGRISYIPASAAEDAYPVEKGEPVWRGFGPTLEERVKQTQKELLALADDQDRLLDPDLKKPTPAQQQAALQGGQLLPGMQNAVREGLTPQRGRGRGYY
ncbi:MAG: hypothetical protein ACP5QZ_09790 [Candidatus Sumerlaeaceae bacterium]